MSTISRTSSVGAAQWAADTINVVPGDGTTPLVNADPHRRDVTIVNDQTSTGDLWLVPTSGQPRGGVRLAPGAGTTLGTTAPVYAYAKNGVVVVSVITESGVNC